MNKILLSVFLMIYFDPQITFSQSDYWIHTNGPHAGTINDYSFGENNIVYAAADDGIYKSYDNGETWNNIGISGVQIWGICKTSSGALLAGIYGNGINRTTNEGVSWVQTTSTGAYIYDIKEINPNLIIFATSGGVFKSTNNGLNWTLTLSGVIATSIDTSSAGEIYISTLDSGIYKSLNNGDNWALLPNSFLGYAYSVNVAINGFIFITTWNGSIYRSIDNGLNFEDLSAKTPIYKTYMSVTTKDGYLYCGTFYQGIWSSSDFGNTWVKQYNGERKIFFVRKLCEGPNGNVFASVQYNGAIRTTDHGVHWNGFSFRTSYSRVDFLLKTNDGKILSSTSQTSFDNGLNWIYSDYYFLPTSFAKNETNGIIYASDGSAVYAPFNGIYKSKNNGEDWEFIDFIEPGYISNVYVTRSGNVYANGSNLYMSTNDGTNWVNLPTLYFYSIAVNNFGHIFGKRNGGLFRSTNNGSNWQNVLPLSNINGAIYSASNGQIYSGGNGTLFKSTNNGDNWTQENISGQVSSIIENQSGRIFVSTYGGGVFMKVEDSWTNITHNLSNSNVTSLCFNDAGQLLAGTDAGAFRTNASVIAINNTNQTIPDKFILEQNYPNPFNPVTVIRYTVPSNIKTQMSNVKLVVYNNLGIEVSNLINENKPAGNYEVEFNGSNLSSGLYFYRLEINGKLSDTRRMVLLK